VLSASSASSSSIKEGIEGEIGAGDGVEAVGDDTGASAEKIDCDTSDKSTEARF
jgi:hypothetical protein